MLRLQALRGHTGAVLQCFKIILCEEVRLRAGLLEEVLRRPSRMFGVAFLVPWVTEMNKARRSNADETQGMAFVDLSPYTKS